MELLESRIFLVFAAASEVNRVRKLLSARGFRNIRWAQNVASAWKSLQESKCDLVISERNLADKDGLELLNKMSEDPVLLLTPMILVTSENRKDKIMEAVYAGVSGYVLKPYSDKTLEEKTIQILKEKGVFIRGLEQVEQGKDMIRQGRLDEAIDSLKEVVSESLDAEHYYQRGYHLMAVGKYDEAIESFRKAIELNHLYADAYQGLGEAYLKKGETEEAEKYLIKAGKLFIQRSRFNEARKSILLVLQVNPSSVNPYNTLGILYRKTGEYEKALESYQMALAINPSDPTVHYNMARAYLEAGNLEKSVECADRALNLKPGFREALELKEYLISEAPASQWNRPLPVLDRYIPLFETRKGNRTELTAEDQEMKRKVLIIQYETPSATADRLDERRVREVWENVVKTGRLHHPGAMVVYDVVRKERRFYIIREYLEGRSLREMMEADKPISLRMALEMGIHAASALGRMHKEDLLHLALDPESIHISRERQIKVGGFSLFEFESVLGEASAGPSGSMSPYFAPEHFSSLPFSPATDVFSLGVLLYELMVREHPFKNTQASATMYSICFVEPKPFRHVHEPFMAAMQAVFQKALAKDPAQRYPTGTELATALEDAMHLLDVHWKRDPRFLGKL